MEALLEVLAEAVAVEPWLDAVVVADVEDVEDVGEVAAVEAVEHEDFVPGVECDGYRVVECGGGGVRAPVDGVDAHHIGGGDYRLHVSDIRYRVVAYRHACVGRVLCRDNPGRSLDIRGCDLVAEHIGGYHAGAHLLGHRFQQFDHRLGALTETCEYNRAVAVVGGEIVVKGVFDVDKRDFIVAA